MCYRSFFGKKDSNKKKPDKTLQTPPSKKAKTEIRHNEDSPIAKKKKRKMVFDSDEEEEKEDIKLDAIKENKPIFDQSDSENKDSTSTIDTIDITGRTALSTSIPADEIRKTPPKRVTGLLVYIFSLYL